MVSIQISFNEIETVMDPWWYAVNYNMQYALWTFTSLVSFGNVYDEYGC